MQLSTIIEEINKIKPFAEEDLTDGPRETYQGREGRQRQAKEQLKLLKEDYITQLYLSSVFVIVAGSGRNELAKIANEEFGFFVSDPEVLFKELADKLPQELYDRKTPISNLFDIMNRYFEEKLADLRITSEHYLTMKDEYLRAVEDKADFVTTIKKAITEQVGPEIVGINAIRALADKAIDLNHGKKVTPIVMAVDDEALALNLKDSLGRIGSRAFLVAAGKGSKTVKSTEGAFLVKEVTKESVESVLSNISKLTR